MSIKIIDERLLSDLGRAAVERRRGARLQLDTSRPSAVVLEAEPSTKSTIEEVATVFLTGAECTYRCTMCDLWRYTLERPTLPGDLIAQLEWALSNQQAADLTKARWIKLYNASNFFDPRSVPVEDLAGIAQRCDRFDRVIVENHPKWIRPAVGDFADMLNGKLEIAMGLETVHPVSIKLLQKGFDLEDFKRASNQLEAMGIDRRAFVMLQPPGTEPSESVDWVMKTLEFAQSLGVRHCSIIPTRMGNGTMEWFREHSLFSSPSLHQLENSLELALNTFPEMIVTVDTWNLDVIPGSCDRCFQPRKELLEAMNLKQAILPAELDHCECSQNRT